MGKKGEGAEERGKGGTAVAPINKLMEMNGPSSF